MRRWILGPLFLLNLALFIWGWTHDQPLEPPLPPIAAAPGRILLASEWLGRDTVTTSAGADLPPTSRRSSEEAAIPLDQAPGGDEANQAASEGPASDLAGEAPGALERDPNAEPPGPR